jgi:hypothetical protein
MSFIRFSNRIVNPAWIQSIEITPAAYKILMSEPHMSGYILFSFGLVDSVNKPLWIDKEKEPADYQLMTTWIQKNSSA